MMKYFVALLCILCLSSAKAQSLPQIVTVTNPLQYTLNQPIAGKEALQIYAHITNLDANTSLMILIEEDETILGVISFYPQNIGPSEGFIIQKPKKIPVNLTFSIIAVNPARQLVNSAVSIDDIELK